MPVGLIATNCEICGYFGYLEQEGAYCPTCGAGPARTSAERRSIVTGRLLADDLGAVDLLASWPGTLPATQTIRRPERAAKGADPLTLPAASQNIVESARGFTDRQIRMSVARLRKKLDRKPTREEVASDLHTTVPTLRRAMQDLEMGPWPPPPPEDWDERVQD
jgi:hypothetical protein